MGAIVLSLAASCSWGVADFLGGVQTRRIPGVLVVAATQLVGLCLLVALVAPFTGLDADASAAVVAAAGGVAGAGGVFSLYAGLALGPMAVVATVSATAAVVPVVFGILTGESPTALEGLGMGLAGGGILLVVQDRPLTEEWRLASGRAIVLGLLAAALLGTALVTLEYSAEETDAISAVVWTKTASVVTLGIAVAATAARISALRDRPLVTLAIGTTDVGGVLLFTLASTLGLLGVVAVLSSLYPVVTIALAHVLLGEHARPIQRLGVAVVLAGVAALSVGT